MSLFMSFYNNVLRRSSTYALGIVCGAFFFERAFDMGSDYLYDEINRGKQWKDIKNNYIPKEDEE